MLPKVPILIRTHASTGKCATALRPTLPKPQKVPYNHPLQWTGPGVGVVRAMRPVASTGRPRPLNGFALFTEAMPFEEHILNAGLLIDRMRKWPSFHDAEVVRVVLDRNGFESDATATFLIHVSNRLNEVDDRGYYRSADHTLVELRARHLHAIELGGFNFQNVILDLNVRSEMVHESPMLRLDMSTSYGLSGHLICQALEVVSVVACDEKGRPASSG